MASDTTYDKEIGLRDLLLQELSDVVDDLMMITEEDPKTIFSAHNRYCILLTICLERCITFGMKDSGFLTKRSFFELLAKGCLNGKDEFLRRDFQCIASLLLKKSGKARAWIRKTLNDGHLATSLYSLASDREFIKSWFEPYAIMSTNSINDLYTEVEKLQCLRFQFVLTDRLLDDDDLFSMPSSQYRGLNKLVRLRVDDDDEDDDEGDDDAVKKEKKRKKKQQRLKRKNSRRTADLNEVNDDMMLTVEATATEDVNKSLTPACSDAEQSSSPSKKDRKKRKKSRDNRAEKEKEKKKKRKKKEKEKETPIADTADVDADEEQELEDDHSLDSSPNSQQRKPSLREWQEQYATQSVTSATTNNTNNNSPSLSSSLRLAAVHQNQSAVNQCRLPARTKSGISDTIRSKLSAIKIQMDGQYDERDVEEQRPFRISSPSDYYATFKWNDAAKDNSAQMIKRLYDENETGKNAKQFPAPGQYEANEQQFLSALDADDDAELDEKQLEKEISTLIQTAAAVADGDEDDEDDEEEEDEVEDLAFISDEDEEDENGDQSEDVPEHISEHTQHPPPAVVPAVVPSSLPVPMSDSKREELLATNDEYHHRRRTLSQNAENENENKNDENDHEPESQTFIHFNHRHRGAPIAVQSDEYFADENQTRDRRKLAQDKESRKRMQREQDVMRGNDTISIQKSLNSSGMSGSGGRANKPLDQHGNKIVLPSTGIILDAFAHSDDADDTSVAQCFSEQQGQCFSCGDQLGSPQMARQCHYTQRLYCALCLDGSVTAVIPSKLIHSLDLRQYAIATNSKRHLQLMYDVPAVPLSKLELPSWYMPSETTSASQHISMLDDVSHKHKHKKHKHKTYKNEDIEAEEEEEQDVVCFAHQNEKYYKLIKMGEYLEFLAHLKELFVNAKQCTQIAHIVHRALGVRQYLLDAFATDKESFGYFLQIIDEHNQSKNKRSRRLYGLISMRDVFELFSKDLLSTLQMAQDTMVLHIRECQSCAPILNASVQTGRLPAKFAHVFK